MNTVHEPLNPLQVQEIAQQPITTIKYEQIDDYNTLEDLFQGKKCLLLLYETNLNVGHWVCLLSKPKEVEFFDPYGIEPDNQLIFTNLKFRKENDMDFPYLSSLLLKDPREIVYNNKRLQLMNEYIETCGYWCGYRMNRYKLSIDEFTDLFKGIPRDEKDDAILQVTENYLTNN